MNKVLRVSLVAMLAVVPAASFAAAGDPQYASTVPAAPVELTAVADVASTSYVKGAYNAAIAVSNKVDQDAKSREGTYNATNGFTGLDSGIAGDSRKTLVGAINAAYALADGAQTAGEVKTAINNAAGDGLSGTNGVLSVNVGTNKGLAIQSDALEVKTGAGLAVDSTGVKAKVDSTHITTDGNGALTLSSGDATAIANVANKLDSSLANVQSAGNYIQSGTNVATNLGNLDSAIKTLDTTTVKTSAMSSSIDSASTNSQVATAKGVYDAVKNKADKGTTLADYGITDAYTKTETNTAINSALSAYTNTTGMNSAISAATIKVHTTWGSDTVVANATNVVNQTIQ